METWRRWYQLYFVDHVCPAMVSSPMLQRWGWVPPDTPDPELMAEAFAEALGVSKETFTKELVASREALQKEFDQQFKEQEVCTEFNK